MSEVGLELPGQLKNENGGGGEVEERRGGGFVCFIDVILFISDNNRLMNFQILTFY